MYHEYSIWFFVHCLRIGMEDENLERPKNALGCVAFQVRITTRWHSQDISLPSLDDGRCSEHGVSVSRR